MTIEVGKAAGGGFTTRFISPILDTGVGTGIIATITPPSGQKVRLVHLRSVSGGSTSNNIEIRVAGVAVKARGNIFSRQSMVYVSGNNNWEIGGGTDSSTGTISVEAYVEGDVDEIIEFHNSSAIGFASQYMYMFGE